MGGAATRSSAQKSCRPDRARLGEFEVISWEEDRRQRVRARRLRTRWGKDAHEDDPYTRASENKPRTRAKVTRERRLVHTRHRDLLKHRS